MDDAKAARTDAERDMKEAGLMPLKKRAEPIGDIAGLGTPQHHRARLASAVRFGHESDAEAAERDLRAANLAKYIKQVVDAAPPLTAEQRLALAGLLVGAENPGGR